MQGTDPAQAATTQATEAAQAVADPQSSPEPVIDALANAINTGRDIWGMNLFRLQDTTITVSQIVIALVTLILGLIVARLISKRISNVILTKMKIEPGPASAIQTVLYYLLLTAVVILALQIAGVPLTVFTIFGGAVAIGVGFGSQNIANNFISGLILLLERPIQVGQFVTVDGQNGTILKIGARATHIQRYDGVTLIVPNSQLLENTVANWYLPDRRVRSVIAVGVAYGSDTALVKKVLESLLDDHVRVLDAPDNRVLFRGFGDSSLDFELHYWCSPRSTVDRWGIESDMRFKIDELFRENNITIPFPQRDLHIRPGPPVHVMTTPSGQDPD